MDTGRAEGGLWVFGGGLCVGDTCVYASASLTLITVSPVKARLKQKYDFLVVALIANRFSADHACFLPNSRPWSAAKLPPGEQPKTLVG